MYTFDATAFSKYIILMNKQFENENGRYIMSGEISLNCVQRPNHRRADIYEILNELGGLSLLAMKEKDAEQGREKEKKQREALAMLNEIQQLK